MTWPRGSSATREEVLASCQARNAERDEAERALAEPSRIQKATAAKPMTQPTDDWVRYIKQQLDKRERSMCGAIADVVATGSRTRRDAPGIGRG